VLPIPPLTLDDEPVPADAGWFGDAACRRAPTSLFFEASTASAAIAFCRSCPVAGECAEYAITAKLDVGVWGGLTGDDRREVAKARGIVWEPEAPPRRECVCGRWARPSRTMCSGCAQRAFRASRR
jgi:WhiB family transcriptional regulator, redox-sensing transcriptional regulator